MNAGVKKGPGTPTRAHDSENLLTTQTHYHFKIQLIHEKNIHTGPTLKPVIVN